jgi:hypothetical protein
MRHRELIVVCSILLLAVALRIFGVAWGQPKPEYFPSYAPFAMVHDQQLAQPDEFLFVALPFKMALTDTLNPKFFENPSFLLNTNYLLTKLTGADVGYFAVDRENKNDRNYAPFSSYVVGRVLSALGGMLTVAGVYAITRTLVGWKGAVLAVLLATVSLPLVQHAHYSTTSSLGVGFATLGMSLCVLALKQNRWLWLFGAGIVVGLGTGNRYNVAIVSLWVLVTGFILLWRTRKNLTLRYVVQIGVSWLAFPITFILTTPFSILDTQKFLQDLRYISNQYLGDGIYNRTTTPLEGMVHLWGYLIVFGLGFASICVLLSVFMWHKHNNTQRWVIGMLWAYLLIYALLITRTVRPVGADQLIIPLVPLCAILAGVGWQWLSERLHPKIQLYAMLFVGLFPLLNTMDFMRAVLFPDTRQVAQDWIWEHLARDTFVRLVGNLNVPLDPQYFRTEQIFDVVGNVNFNTLPPSDYLIISRAFEQQQGKVSAFSSEILPEGAQLVFSISQPLNPTRSAWLADTSNYWHNPTIEVYCLNERACNATILANP